MSVPGPGLGPVPGHVLILGGTTEARRLAEALHEGQRDGDRGYGDHGFEGHGYGGRGHGGHGRGAGPYSRPRVTTSLAGRVARPAHPPGEVRTGGFGGAAGLAAWLREQRVDALVDATHPFAGTMSFHAATAATETGVPLLALRRPGWSPVPGDRWHSVGSLDEAAGALPGLGRRVLLTTGRTGLAAFAALDGLWFLARSVEAPVPPHPARMEVLLDRGPFTLEGERELLRRHRVDVVVTKDSGGAATAPKLAAAREAGLPVVVVRRPPVPEGVPLATTVGEAVAWLGRGQDSG